MFKNKIVKTIFILAGVGVLIAGGIGYYMFNMPHRDVQATTSDYKLSATEIVDEYLKNSAEANNKYLDDEGESKILEVTGTVASISTDFNNQVIVLLKNKNASAGVLCTFTEATNNSAKALKKGEIVLVKGVIRSGASYDEDLELYEHVILEKCSLLTK